MKKAWLFFALVIIGIGLGVVLSNRPTPQPLVTVESKPEKPAEPVAPPAQAPAAPVVVEQPAAEVATAPGVRPASKPKRAAPAQAQNNQPANPGKEPLHDPAARDALALVGVDPNAEQYWVEAIFDTSLPDHEREDLMEDLNETGFADPKNLTADDLPLIVSRMAIIQQIAPFTDPFMADHLGEAYKDLSNMYNRAAGH